MAQISTGPSLLCTGFVANLLPLCLRDKGLAGADARWFIVAGQVVVYAFAGYAYLRHSVRRWGVALRPALLSLSHHYEF